MAAKKKYASIPYVNGYLCTNVLADCYPPDTTTDFCVVGSIPAKNISVEYSIVTLAQLHTIIWENQNLLNKN